MRTLSLPSRRARTSCSVLALATVFVVGATPASAQSFQGTGTFTTNSGGVADISAPPGTTTTITVNPGQTVIDWVPFDNVTNNNVPILFQNSGTTATFLGTGNYAVLNNISVGDLSRVISMNGTITAGALGAAAAANGSIYFYSPSGFLLGANSIINVGSLVLSASPLMLDGSGNFITGGSNVTFGQALRPGASIFTTAGSQINATAGDAYVAMVAPRVDHRGSIDVNGSAALVGAEAATINFSPDGLFDIQVTAGTTDAQGVFTNGNITGSASTGAADARRAFLVAVPKNTALTMAIGSGADLGFAIAGAANVSGNAVILSAGHDIVDGEIGGVSAGSVPGTLANLISTGLNATSGVRAVATNFAEFYAGAGQANSFASDLDIRAPGRAWVNATGVGTSITIVRDLVLNSDRVATVAGGSATGGFAALYTDANGTITVGQNATVTANGTGANSSTAGIAGGIGTGGTAVIQNQAAGGTINIIGNAVVSANGTGGSGLVAGANGAAGTGGVALLRSFASGTSLTVGGTATVQALGTGGSGLGCVGCIGGAGTGGFAQALADQSSTLSIAGMLRVNAEGRGGSGATGRGGTADVFAGANSSLSAGSLNATADGHGGADAGAGTGNGFGGTARIRATGTEASIAIANVVTTGNSEQRDLLSADGFGGETNGGGSGIGGTGTGGTLTLSATAGGSIALPNLVSTTDLRIRARGYGGDSDTDGTTGGLGVGGTVNLSLDNGTLTAGPVQLSAVGLGGNSFGIGNINGGHGIGGTRNISAINGSTLSIGLAGGVAGGGGGKASGTGVGGNGSGGTASLLVDASTVNFTSRSGIIVQNAGGDGAIGGNASGGNATVTVRNGGIINIADDPSSTDDFVIGSFAYGGIGAGAQGGNATAGNVSLLLQGGTINLTGNMTVGAEARAGRATTAGGFGGDATGGNVIVLATGGNSLITGPGALRVSADAFGGSYGGINGGDAQGGSVVISAEGGAGLTIQNNLTASANATGGGGADGGNATSGSGGDAIAGDVDIWALTGGTLQLLGANNLFSTNATGGDTDVGDGGMASEGEIEILADGTESIVTISGVTIVSSNAEGGSSESGVGGDAHGGDIDIYAKNGGSLTFGNNLTASADADGAAGILGGGDAYGGNVSIYSYATLRVDGTLTASATATGGGVPLADSSGHIGGTAEGGNVDLYAEGGLLTVAGAVNLSTNATGGAVENGGDMGGYGHGGETYLYARADGTIDLQSSLTVSATGRGGDFGGFGTTGGDGMGGQIAIQADGANASVTVGATELDASGSAADGGGGSGTGGIVLVEAFGAPTASLNFLNNLLMYATGVGGSGYYGSGGLGQGGTVLLKATEGATITVGGNLVLNSSASGGFTYDYDYDLTSSGGNAVGGTSLIEVFGTGGLGGTIAILGNADVTADGEGGGAHGAPSGQGGDGVGGIAHILATSGSITIGQDGPGGGATVSADGTGGFAAGATGGDGVGGEYAVIEADGGDITIYGSALVSASGTGGYGLITGGDGVGSGDYDELTMTWTGGAHIYARNGDIVIGGGATVMSVGTGGGGLNEGGHGGAGYGGYATIHAANSNLGSSSISIVGGELEGSGYAEVNVSGTGGNGGNNANGSAGGDGGNGGIGRGGTGSISAAAGNGTVTIDQAYGYAIGTGGYGGDGGNGGECFSCDGGNGGNGGLGRGGYITIGTVSGNGQATGANLGFGDYGSITADVSGIGGFGGNGGFGATNGNGGNGGNAFGGGVDLLVRGSTVDVDVATLTADATGGDGGLGDGETSSDGNGGNATVGSNAGPGFMAAIHIVATGRYLIPTQRGTLNAGAITGTAIAIGGDGATDGASLNLGGSTVTFLNADGNIGSLDILVQAEAQAGGAANESISIINGQVVVDDEFNPEFRFVTSGNLSLFADNADMHTGFLTLSAANFVFDAVNDPPLDRGTYFADVATITTLDNFVTSADLDIAGDFEIIAPGLINAANINAGGELYLEAQGGSIATFNLAAGGNIDLVAATDIMIGNATAGSTIDMDAGGYIDGGNMTAGDSVYAEAGEYVDLLNISAGIDIQKEGDAEYNVGILAGTTIETGDIEALNSIGLGALDDIYTGSIDAGNIFLALGGGDMSFGTINSGGTTYLAHSSMIAFGEVSAFEFDPAPILALQPVASGGSITLRGPVDAGRFEAAAGTTLTGTTIDTNGLLYAASGGNMTLTDLEAGGDVRLTSGADITTGYIYSYDDVALTSVGNISTLEIFAYDDVSADAGGTISTDDITANSIDLFADGNISTEDLRTREFFFQEGFGTQALVAGASITLQSGGNIETFTIDSIDGVHLSAAGSISTLAVDAVDFVEMFAGGNITAGTINAGSDIDIFSDTGLLDLEDLHAGDEIDLETEGAIIFGDVTADDFNFDAGGTVDGGNIVAVSHADGHAEGALTLKDITVTGPPTYDDDDDDDFSIGFTSATSIRVEDVDGFDRVGFATLGNLTTGNITAGSLVLALVGGDIVTGSITTDAGGRVYMANASMCGDACGDDDNEESEVEVEDLLALNPVPTGGSILIDGPVTTGLFQAAAGTGLTTQAITADDIQASAGGTATLNGVWNFSNFATLESNDINITGTGGIDGGTTGEIVLISSNPTQMLIGDGLSGTGYSLSNAEFGRLSGGDVTIIGRGDASAAIDMLIGDLTVTGPTAGSTIEDSGDGVLAFGVGDIDSESASGVIRVVGDINATGFSPDNSIEFYATRFELDAATGSISITGNGGALAGTLGLYASRIHVAEGTILDLLAVNPQYAGYREALNAPAAVQRPEGVLRAANFHIENEEGPIQSFLVQNTGTTATPAGFLLTDSDLGGDDEGGDDAPGSINLVINGQIITQAGTLTGIAVRDLLVAEEGTTQFVAGSTINGCPLTGSCTSTPIKVDTVTGADIQLSDAGGLGDGLFGNEGDIDDGESGDESDQSSPIAPPNPLFDSRPLAQSSDVDDPVSGAGNPSLYGSPGEDANAEDCDGDKDKKCTTDAKGDGK